MRRDRTDFIHRSSHLLLASTMLIGSGAAFAQDAAPPQPSDTAAEARAAAQDEDMIVVTAQRREENLQDVPIAITALTTKTLDDLQVDSFEDYARLVPSLSFKGGGSGGSAAGPGNNAVYFRGVASGENGNHSSSLPSVGTYLDEQQITTIIGALDVHVFDIARVEALAGPQGSLYGASSQAGTIRLITNRPDLGGTYGEANLEVNKVAHGDWGYTGEGFVNAPLTKNIAARVVGWYRRDGGYIDNIPGTMTFATAGITIDNDDVAENDYNDVTTYGARAALKIDLDSNWTVTPAIMGQRQVSHGTFSQESGLGPLEVMQFNPERSKDRWVQAALTVEGKLGNFDVTYAGSLMRRRVESAVDYADYAYFYDNIYGSTFYDNLDNTVDPNQRVEADHHYRKFSQELRFTSPADRRVRLVGGLFYQRQTDSIEENYIIDDIADAITVPGTDSNIWLTKQFRVDRDYAVFGEVAFDIMPQLTLTGGGRFYKFDNSLKGFFGFNENWFDPGTGTCFGPPEVDGTPCTNVDKRTKDTGFVHRLNATYKPNDDLLFYATWSRGFRPGGINRRGTLPPYKPDFLTNYEVGTKYSFGRGSHFNITAYREDWSDIQLSFLGENGLTEIRNAGDARIWGVEADLLLRLAPGLSWSSGVAYNDASIRRDFCSIANDAFDCTIDKDLNGNGIIEPDEGEENALLAPAGRRLPITAKFKGNSRLRYEWTVGGDMKAHVQGVVTYEGKRRRDLRTFENSIYGNMDAFTQVDVATGLDKGPWSLELYAKNLFDVRGQQSKSIQCLESTCGDPDGVTARGGIIYTGVTRPRLIGVRIGRKF
ncbi:MAG: TonB-dependent receptor [Sphingomicrobium sp.]